MNLKIVLLSTLISANSFGLCTTLLSHLDRIKTSSQRTVDLYIEAVDVLKEDKKKLKELEESIFTRDSTIKKAKKDVADQHAHVSRLEEDVQRIIKTADGYTLISRNSCSENDDIEAFDIKVQELRDMANKALEIKEES